MGKEIYATMITPFKDGNVDYETVRKLVRWYWKEGCDGIFVSCLSSEIFQLSLEDRVRLVREVVNENRELSNKDKSRKPMVIVASGHISEKFSDQVEELCATANEKPDALILITNRFDIENTSDEKWIEDAERLISRLPNDIPLGVYECPVPYKRLLSEKMIKWCVKNERFKFIKDTCCDIEMMKRRIELCKGSNLMLYNANTETLLESVDNGVCGYCGVMANIHPALYVKLLNDSTPKETKRIIQAELSAMSNMMVNTGAYPAIAKYYLSTYEKIEMEITAKSNPIDTISDYQKMFMEQIDILSKHIESRTV